MSPSKSRPSCSVSLQRCIRVLASNVSTPQQLNAQDDLDMGSVATSAAQSQTQEAFGFKWGKRDTYESPAVKRATRQWLLERYCGGDESLIDGWLAGGRKLILDAGCGAGFSAMLFFGDRLR